MSPERRRHTRILRPIDGRWRGGSAGGACRIGDLSLGGCFVHCLSTPRVGEATTVTFRTHDSQELTIEGTVVHVEARIGFSVQFADVPAEDAQHLQIFLDHLQKA